MQVVGFLESVRFDFFVLMFFYLLFFGRCLHVLIRDDSTLIVPS